MSLQEVRDALGAAVGAVDGVTAFTDYPDSPQAGDAHVTWLGLTAQGAPGLFETTWAIRVVGGGTPADALAFMDARLSDILESLEGLVYVTDVRVASWNTDSGDAYGVVITGNRE